MHHKHSEYNPPLPPPSGWSGGTLDISWTYPGTIDHPQAHIFDQARLSKSISCGFSSVQRCLGLDVKCRMLDVRCSARQPPQPESAWFFLPPAYPVPRQMALESKPQCEKEDSGIRGKIRCARESALPKASSEIFRPSI
jgi:hypothetical protein